MALLKLTSGVFLKHFSSENGRCQSVVTNLFNRMASTNNSSPHTANIKFLERGENKVIAYKNRVGKDPLRPGIIFCAGFQSNMHGVKATALDSYCQKNDLSFVRFDYQGVGDSSGDIREATITDWRGDLLAVLDQLTAGPQILVGSSLGGLLMFHTYLQRPHRIKALVGVSTAADLPERFNSYWGQQVQEQLKTKEEVHFASEDHNSFIITQNFIENAKKHSILKMDMIPVSCPVRLLHGLRDEVVPFQVSLDLAKKLKSTHVNLLFRKNGDHRFSQPEDITLLFEVLQCFVHGTKHVRDMALSSWQAFSVYSRHGEEEEAEAQVL